MSWSITLIGKPEKVAEVLEANSAKLSGQSKVEFDAALPHQKPQMKVPISKERIEEVKKLIAAGKGKDAAAVLRQVREKLENFSRTI